MHWTTDIAIIGSGFGGAFAAHVLTETGLRVTLLERGPWRDTLPVRSMEIPERAPLPRGVGMFSGLLRTLGANAWLPEAMCLNRHGLFEFYLAEGVRIACSSGVGGGSHVWSGATVRPLVPGYWEDHAPGISNDAMERHYLQAIDVLEAVRPTPEHRIPNLAAVRFRDSDVLAPLPPAPDARLAYALPADPAHPRSRTTAAGVSRREVDYRRGDDGFLGSPAGGKATLDAACLAGALQRGLAVYDLCEVTALASRDDGGRPHHRVTFTDLRSGREDTLDAAYVVLGAGTLNTLRLLLKSAARGHLRPMPALGRRFGTNGDLFGFWDWNDPALDLGVGLPTAGGVKLRDDPDPPVIGGGGWPSVDAYPLPRWLRTRIRRGSFIAGMGEDAMDGRVSLRGERLHVAFDPAHSPIFARLRRTFEAMGQRTGRRICCPRVPITVHPMGGACLGADAEHGVVDARGEVFGNPGLYVVDAAALPRAPGGPPSLAIAGWALHVAHGLAAHVAG